MRIPRLRSAAIIVAAGVGLGGCATYSPFGYGSGLSVSVGSGYGNYGYGRHGFYDPFYDPYYMGYRSYYGSRFGGWYGSPYGGWYNGFYYPGSGIYVYNRDRQRLVWSDGLRNYWSTRRQRLEASGVANPAVNLGTTTTTRRSQAIRERPVRTRATSEARVESSTRPASAERTRATRAERREERAAERASRRSERDDD